MAKLMKNRTDNDIKNKWNSMLRTQRAQLAKFEEYREEEEIALRITEGDSITDHRNFLPSPAFGGLTPKIKEPLAGGTEQPGNSGAESMKMAPLAENYVFFTPGGTNIVWDSSGSGSENMPCKV